MENANVHVLALRYNRSGCQLMGVSKDFTENAREDEALILIAAVIIIETRNVQ